jgi:hypothetical protein
MASWQVVNNALDLAASLDLINQLSLTCAFCMIATSFGVLFRATNDGCNAPNRRPPWWFCFMYSGLRLGRMYVSSAVWGLTPGSNNARTKYLLVDSVCQFVY